ncbi:MAG: VOC family protein [Cyanobacteriota bacterium]
MTFELDHLFIGVTTGAPEAERLIQAGLQEGSRNIHPGQGTANRRFFFHNLMLELLWVADAEEAQSPLIQPTYLWERWSGRKEGSCPFGICLRPEAGTAHEGSLPFHSWPYRPPYLPEPLSISVATNAQQLTEPMLFFLGFASRPDTYPPERAQPLQHPLGVKEVSRVRLSSPAAEDPSPELRSMLDLNLIEWQAGSTYHLELGFDGERLGKRLDFDPDLPLRFCW